jgi:hypothetical protein
MILQSKSKNKIWRNFYLRKKVMAFTLKFILRNIYSEVVLISNPLKDSFINDVIPVFHKVKNFAFLISKQW